MYDPFSVLTFSNEEMERDETLGSKVKFWFNKDGLRWLYKEARENTGEDWSEKLAAEIAQLMRIPAAEVKLAQYGGSPGSASLRFLDPKLGQGLLHGNEILAGTIKNYNAGKTFKQSEHTFHNIHDAIVGVFHEPDVYDVILRQLAGYMVLDALIGNTDRHHENWGLILAENEGNNDNELSIQLSVAPTFDHASSLGRELRDERRSRLLQTNTVANYAQKGRGAIFLSSADAHGANPLRLVELGARKFDKYFQPNLKRLESFQCTDLYQLVDRVPEDRMSGVAKDFTKIFLKYTYESLN